MEIAMKFLTTLILALGLTRAATAETLIFAAASLTEALTEIASAYEKTGAAKPVFSFASSSTLAKQIENKAPAAIFISADEQWMDYVAQRNLITPDSRVGLLGNWIVLVSTASDPLVLTIDKNFALAAALKGGKLALADPDSVPAGRYAKAALENLGVWSSVEAAVVRAENVRAALTFVERGEAKAGVVYATDAALAKNIRVVGVFPPESHPPIVYPAALVGANPDAEAKAFFAFMTSDAAKAIYRRYGFTVK
jgi:molybdate transport system substrate-binding protein